MSEPKMCCNCLHCARWRRKNGIETHCDLTDKYLGYLDVMGEANDCKHWEKETKWDLQREHDTKVRTDTIDECFNKIEQRLNDDTEISVNLPVEEVLGDDVDVNGFLMLAEAIVQKYKGLVFSKLKEAKHQLKEQNIK